MYFNLDLILLYLKKIYNFYISNFFLSNCNELMRFLRLKLFQARYNSNNFQLDI